MITRLMLILMIAIVVYAYAGYGLVVWIILQWRKFKKTIWNYLR